MSHRQQPNMFHRQLQNISHRQQPNISHRQQPSMFHKQQQSSNQKPILQPGLYRGRRRQQCLVRKHDRPQRLFLKKPSSQHQHQNLLQKRPQYLAGVVETHLAEDSHLVSTLLLISNLKFNLFKGTRVSGINFLRSIFYSN